MIGVEILIYYVNHMYLVLLIFVVIVNSNDILISEYEIQLLSFIERTNERERFIEKLDQLFILHDIDSVLSIGSGDGTLDKMLIEKLSNATIYDFIEPNQNFNKYLIKMLHSLNSNGIIHKSNQIINTRIEDWIPSKKYDLVVMPHVAYHINNIGFEIKRLLQYSKNIIIYIQTDETFTYKIQKLFNPNFTTMTSTNITDTLDEMSRMLNINYYKSNILCEFNISNIKNHTVNFIAGKILNKVDMDKVIKTLKTYSVDNQIHFTNTIFII